MFDAATLVAKLKGHSLPVIRQTSAQIISLLSNPSTRTQAIADLILRDQAFTARVLKVANSAFYRRRDDKITTITSAIALIGFTTLRDIALAAEFAEFAQKKLPTTINLRRVLAKAFVAANQATALGRAVQLPDAEALFTSALMESLGEFALASAMPDVAKQIEDACRTGELPYSDAHTQVTGLTPHAVTKIVAGLYEFPDELILPPPTWETLAKWTPANRRSAAVHLANACAANLFAPETARILLQFTALMSQITSALALPAVRAEAILTEAFHKAVELGATVDLDRTCFALEETDQSEAGRHTLIQCIEQTAAAG
jgi:HD-like signal output (HDOD) protein